MKTLRTLALALVFALSAPVFAGEEPCDTLDEPALDRYNALGDQALERYGQKDYSGAVEAILELREICSEDPRLEYNLARAFHRAGNCNMARFWYEEVLARDESSYGELVKEEKRVALTSITELEQVCVNSTRIVLLCAEPDEVTLTLGDAFTGKCPGGARVDAGTYTLTATRPGFQDYTTQVELQPREHNRVFIPPLEPIPPTLTTATVALRCVPELGEVLLTDTEREHRANCAAQPEHTLEVAAGAITLSVPKHNIQRELVVEPGTTLQLELLAPTGPVQVQETPGAPPLPPPRDRTLQLVGWITAGVGVAALGTGVALHFVAQDEIDTLFDTERDANGVVQGFTETEAQNIIDDAADLDTTAILIGGVGGGLLITGIVLLLVDDLAEREADAELRATVGADHVLLELRGSF